MLYSSLLLFCPSHLTWALFSFFLNRCRRCSLTRIFHPPLNRRAKRNRPRPPPQQQMRWKSLEILILGMPCIPLESCCVHAYSLSFDYKQILKYENWHTCIFIEEIRTISNALDTRICICLTGIRNIRVTMMYHIITS